MGARSVFKADLTDLRPEQPDAVAGPHRATLRRVLLTALGVAIAGSTALGLAETLIATVFVYRNIRVLAPPDFLLAAWGRAATTHMLLWVPALLLVGLLVHALRRRRDYDPLAWLAVSWAFAATVTVGYADLTMLKAGAWLRFGCSLAAGIVLGGIILLVLRKFLRRGSRPRVLGSRVLVLVSIIGLAVAIPFWRCSPLAGPGRYRVGSPGQEPVTRSGPPDVLWIVMDTTRADRMSVYDEDSDTTPFLRSLAQDAQVFDQAVSNGIWTVPAHASMFTGLSAREHGTDHRNLNLEERFTTVAEILSEHGYATAAFSGNPLVAPRTNLVQGFDRAWVMFDLRRIGRFSLGFLSEWFGLTPRVDWLDVDQGAAMTNAVVARWLDQCADQAALVFVNYMEAHLPYRAPRRYRRMHMTDAQVHRSYDLRYSVYGNLVPRFDLDFNIDGPAFADPQDLDILPRQYKASIHYLDDRIRELFRIFEQRGRLDNTLVVVVSDHGEYLNTHGMWGHRFLAYQDTIHVALMLRPPQRLPARRVSTPVQLSDLFATVVETTVGPDAVPEAINSVNLLRLPEGGDPERIAISEYNGPAPSTLHRFENMSDPEVLRRTVPQIAAVGRRFKFLRSANGRRELYDLQEDPHEQQNLINATPEQAKRLEARIDDWLARTPVHETPAGQRPSEDVLRTLRALGYIGAEDEPP